MESSNNKIQLIFKKLIVITAINIILVLSYAFPFKRDLILLYMSCLKLPNLSCKGFGGLEICFRYICNQPTGSIHFPHSRQIIVIQNNQNLGKIESQSRQNFIESGCVINLIMQHKHFVHLNTDIEKQCDHHLNLCFLRERFFRYNQYLFCLQFSKLIYRRISFGVQLSFEFVQLSFELAVSNCFDIHFVDYYNQRRACVKELFPKVFYTPSTAKFQIRVMSTRTFFSGLIAIIIKTWNEKKCLTVSYYMML